MKTARQITVEALIKVNSSGGYSNLVLDNIIAKNKLDMRDASFATALFYGVLERMITLDHCINGFSKIKMKNMSPTVREILRISIYQLLYMDAVPESAAVNEGVNLTRAMGQDKASGFVNGVLREFVRSGKRVPRMAGSRADQMSIQYSCPAWLVDKLINSYGEENTEGVLKTSLGKPPVYIRVNTLKIDEDKLVDILELESAAVHRDTGVANSLRVTNTGDITTHTSFKKGQYHVQDLSSQLCAMALSPQKGERILDVCSAPGGKAFTIAELMENTGELYAFDLHESRTRLIDDGARRLGISIIKTRINDATIYNEALGEFDKVLCDVPCSGFGIIRRKPEIKYKPEETIKELPQIQYKILEISSQYLKVGGTLLYSTCTLNKEENEDIVEKFLSEHKNFEKAPLSEYFGGNDYKRTFFPHTDNSDGFFISTIRRIK